jgi:cellobiose PTS system EIIA component
MDNILERMQEIAFEIISSIGEAKTFYMNAINLASENRIEEAKEAVVQGNAAFAGAHDKHLEIIQREANGEQLPFSVLFIHSEDQLMSTELIRDMANQLIKVYEQLHKTKS